MGLCQNCKTMRPSTVQTPTKKPNECIREIMHMDSRVIVRIRATK